MGNVTHTIPPTVQVAGFDRPHAVTVDEADVQVVNFVAPDLGVAIGCAALLAGLADGPVRGVEAQEYRTRDGRWNFRVVLTWDRRREVRP